MKPMKQVLDDLQTTDASRAKSLRAEGHSLDYIAGVLGRSWHGTHELIYGRTKISKVKRAPNANQG